LLQKLQATRFMSIY